MSSIGPSLPPHLSKRKRTPEESEDAASPPPKQARNADEIALEDDESDDGFGPSAPSAQAPTRPVPKPSKGPAMPPAALPRQSNEAEINLDDDSEDEDQNYGPAVPKPSAAAPLKPAAGPSAPPKRAIGPAMPPPDTAAADDHQSPESEDDADDDDDYGPAPPKPSLAGSGPQVSIFDQPKADSSLTSEPRGPQRDDWMLAPPSASQGYRERDPTKLKSRRFASGNKPHAPAPGAGGPAEISSIWTETPEQKRKRLEDAVLGRAPPAGSDAEAAAQRGSSNSQQSGERSRGGYDERDRRTAENVAAAKGKSLYDEHQGARRRADPASTSESAAGGKGRKEEEEEDDPSKRAFDREKDMALGGRINTSQRRELMNNAKDFGGRFQKGSFL